MNNLFKSIFLIVNLVASTTSSVDNFSLPLLETDLKMGQNIPELVEGREPMYLHSGFGVTKISVDKGGIPCQRSCTLSFPVSLNDNKRGLTYKGFLTSFTCTTSSVLKDNALVAHVLTAYNFKPELGLEYAFVSVYPEY